MGNSIIEAQQEYFATQFKRVDGGYYNFFYEGLYFGSHTPVHFTLQERLLDIKQHWEQFHILTAAHLPP